MRSETGGSQDYSGLYDEYQKWAGNPGMNQSYFTAMCKTLDTALAQGKADAAGGLDGVWKGLSPQQRQTVQELLGRYGYRYEAWDGEQRKKEPETAPFSGQNRKE